MISSYLVLFKQTAVKLLVVFAILGLVACGGGDDPKPTPPTPIPTAAPTPEPTPEPDTTPADFTLTLPQATYLRGEVATTEQVTITEIDTLTDISISAGGEYSIDGGSFTGSAGQIANEQTLVARATAGSNFGDEVEVTVTVGTKSESFTVVTEAEDVNPDTFELGEDATVSVPGETAESGIITITGINSPANISISNGEYRIEGVQEYGSASSTVAPGQQVQVRVTAGSQINMTETATLTIGDQSDTFGVTATDQTPPTAEVVFPTANTMSDGSFVTLRGKASDDFGPVTQIQVIVTTDDGAVQVDNETITAGTGEDFQETWSVRVDLASEKLNTLQITATDAGGNTQETPVTLTVLQTADALTSLFPEGNDVLIGAYDFFGIGWDREANRLFLPRRSPHQILEIDLTTGRRSVFIDEDPAFNSFSMLAVLSEENTLLFADQNNDIIFQANLDTSDWSVLTDINTPDSNTDILGPYSMELGSNGDVYVADAGGSFYSVNMTNGARTLISDATRPDTGENPFTNPVGVALDESNNRALISDYTTQQLLWVDLDSGDRTVWVDSDELEAPFEIKLDADDNRIILTDVGLDAVVAIDLSNAALTILSDDATPVGGANSLENPWGIVIDDEDDIAFVGSNYRLDERFTAVLQIDLNTGERIILTNSVQ